MTPGDVITRETDKIPYFSEIVAALPQKQFRHKYPHAIRIISLF